MLSYDAVSTHLAMLSDRELADLVAQAEPRGTGIGGRSAELEINARRVFTKRVPLTDLETRPENMRSTANLFGLPSYYHYGIGSAGFGAWRELAAHVITTWVLTNAHAGFPLLYHWRIVPDTPPEGFVDEFGGIDQAVAHWEGSPAIRRRLEAIAESSLSLVLVLEHLPQAVASWLSDRHGATTPHNATAAPYPWIEQTLAHATSFMSSRGFVHFDAHFLNLLTDGQEIYFADFGLALSSQFSLSAEESRFLASHLSYDRHYTTSHLLRHHLPRDLRGSKQHTQFLRDWTTGNARRQDVPDAVAKLIDRHAATALIFDQFHHQLINESKKTPYPHAELDLTTARA
ncbi:protein kinase family protein [Sphaerisporangium sp. NPDC051011]|uniref:protein kinase family protein n=1 Tax=Sphaerisporangium sp. NPDC051011 TaxID=3155792 RepID=UPI0033DC44CD